MISILNNLEYFIISFLLFIFSFFKPNISLLFALIIPFSVIKLVTYLFGVISKAKL